ncbi:MAG TPA: MBL fold metallo-hydrolase [Clostridiaceae bacterium]|nr:MBL fold metallo-hydrolase [Clostridiaceae bacterium]
MKLTVFGNNATYPMADGACSCYLLETAADKILMDMGNGSMAKLQRKIDLSSLDIIIISHLHFDHMADLFCAKYQLETRRAKGEKIDPVILIAPMLPDWAREELLNNNVFRYIEISDGMVYPLGKGRIIFTKVVHLIESYAVRVEEDDKVFVYSGDTGLCPEIQTAAQNADLFLCEATMTESENIGFGHHLSAKSAAVIAHKAKVKKLLLTHLPTDHKDRVLEEAVLHFQDTEVSEILGEYAF